MKPKLNFNLDKKHKFLIQSVLVAFFILYVSFDKIHLPLIYLVVISTLLVLLGTFLIQYPSLDFTNLFYSILMPGSLLFGALLFVSYFPNLGLPFKLFTIIAFGTFYYLVCLVDNIFLVIEDREEVIPLYRAATAWSQIMQVIIAIPLFSGIFKMNLNGFTQSLIIGFFTFLFVLYQIWISRYDKDAKKTGVGEIILLSSMTTFIVMAINTAISFIPTEAFLRSLLDAVILMFGLSYVSSYLRNDITKKTLAQFAFIFGFFLLILILFMP